MRIQGAAESLQKHPISFPEAPGGSQMPPARAPKRFQNHLRIANVVFRTCSFSTGKPSFLKVRGSAREFKIEGFLGGFSEIPPKASNNSLRFQISEEEGQQEELKIPMFTITRVLRASVGALFAIICNVLYFEIPMFTITRNSLCLGGGHLRDHT